MPPNIRDIYRQQGWNDSAAIEADINAGGWTGKYNTWLRDTGQMPSSSGSGVSQQNVEQIIADSFKKLTNEFATRWKNYQGNQPFRIDDILAAKANMAKEQIDPYYNETLSDYLLGVQRKRERSQADTRDLMSELSAETEQVTINTQNKLEQALEKARQGFAGAGLFESGQRYRGEGILGVETADTLEGYQRRQGLRGNIAQTDLSRTLADLASGQRQTVRDVERQRFSDIEARKGQLAKEAGGQYVQGFKATLPPELQAQTGFDLLKDIGFYG